MSPKQRALAKEFAQGSEAVSLGNIRAEQGRGWGTAARCILFCCRAGSWAAMALQWSGPVCSSSQHGQHD